MYMMWTQSIDPSRFVSRFKMRSETRTVPVNCLNAANRQIPLQNTSPHSILKPEHHRHSHTHTQTINTRARSLQNITSNHPQNAHQPPTTISTTTTTATTDITTNHHPFYLLILLQPPLHQPQSTTNQPTNNNPPSNSAEANSRLLLQAG